LHSLQQWEDLENSLYLTGDRVHIGLPLKKTGTAPGMCPQFQGNQHVQGMPGHQGNDRPDEFLERDTNMLFTMRALMYFILKTKANKFQS